MSKRRAFNFYRSFYDCYVRLKTDKEKVEFIDALLERQFNGTIPTGLKGMAEFAYDSQRQVIDQQIEGWESKTGQKLQDTDLQTSEPLGKGGAKGGQSTPSAQEKGEGQGKEKGKEKGAARFDFKSSLISIGVDEQVASDWMAVRRKKKAADTETAFNSIKNQIDKCDYSANECITEAVTRSWIGFKAEWMGKDAIEETDPAKMSRKQRANKIINGKKYNSGGEIIVGWTPEHDRHLND